jgi:hypothetical protein
MVLSRRNCINYGRSYPDFGAIELAFQAPWDRSPPTALLGAKAATPIRNFIYVARSANSLPASGSVFAVPGNVGHEDHRLFRRRPTELSPKTKIGVSPGLIAYAYPIQEIPEAAKGPTSSRVVAETERRPQRGE